MRQQHWCMHGASHGLHHFQLSIHSFNNIGLVIGQALHSARHPSATAVLSLNAAQAHAIPFNCRPGHAAYWLVHHMLLEHQTLKASHAMRRADGCWQHARSNTGIVSGNVRGSFLPDEINGVGTLCGTGRLLCCRHAKVEGSNPYIILFSLSSPRVAVSLARQILQRRKLTRCLCL